MTKKKNETEKRVCYVRVSEYYRQFYKVKYGGEPIVFPENHPLQGIILANLCQNKDLRALTPHSFSQLAFDYEREGKVFDIEIACPDPDRREEFLEVQIPEYVYRRGVQYKTSSNWQLSKAGAELFRKEMKRDFWVECTSFIEDCMVRAHANGEHVTLENAMSDFMLMFDIPMAYHDNLLRYERRSRPQMVNGIEQKRDRMEKKTGNVFFYT